MTRRNPVVIKLDAAEFGLGVIEELKSRLRRLPGR